MTNNLSWRHHYIPQFYLKGFTNTEGKFFIYDKVNDKIKDQEFTPRTHFFQKHRNTIKIEGIENDFIETILYKDLDNTISKLFEEIHNKDGNYLTPENLFALKMFISFLFWRVPKNDSLINHYIDNYTFEELGFELKEKDSKKNVSEEIRELFKTNSAFRRMYSFILPFQTFKLELEEGEENMWKSIPGDEGDPIRMTSDAPIITLNQNLFYDNSQKILFPVTSNKLLYYGTIKNKRMIPPEFYIFSDLAMVENATQFVCCSNKLYLDQIIELYRLRIKYNKTNEIIPTLFDFL